MYSTTYFILYMYIICIHVCVCVCVCVCTHVHVHILYRGGTYVATYIYIYMTCIKLHVCMRRWLVVSYWMFVPCSMLVYVWQKDTERYIYIWCMHTYILYAYIPPRRYNTPVSYTTCTCTQKWKKIRLAFNLSPL